LAGQLPFFRASWQVDVTGSVALVAGRKTWAIYGTHNLRRPGVVASRIAWYRRLKHRAAVAGAVLPVKIDVKIDAKIDVNAASGP